MAATGFLVLPAQYSIISLNKYPIAFCRVIDKYMCYRPHKLPILYNRRTAHSLYDSACRLQQPLIRYLHDKIFIAASAVIINTDNFYMICACFSMKLTQHHGITDFKFTFFTCRKRFFFIICVLL